MGQENIYPLVSLFFNQESWIDWVTWLLYEECADS